MDDWFEQANQEMFPVYNDSSTPESWTTSDFDDVVNYAADESTYYLNNSFEEVVNPANDYSNYYLDATSTAPADRSGDSIFGTINQTVANLFGTVTNVIRGVQGVNQQLAYNREQSVDRSGNVGYSAPSYAIRRDDSGTMLLLLGAAYLAFGSK